MGCAEENTGCQSESSEYAVRPVSEGPGKMGERVVRATPHRLNRCLLGALGGFFAVRALNLGRCRVLPGLGMGSIPNALQRLYRAGKKA